MADVQQAASLLKFSIVNSTRQQAGSLLYVLEINETNHKPDHGNNDRAPALIRGAQNQKTQLLLSDLRA